MTIAAQPERMASEITDLIFRVNEPYRRRMLIWLEKCCMCSIEDPKSELTHWLSQMDEFDRHDQFELLKQVAYIAPRVFAA